MDVPKALRTDPTIEERKESIITKGKQKKALKCDTDSVAGCVSQRACVYCGARVVLNPVTDAIHLVHGPIGCASYTWDIRGSLSSGSQLYRNSLSTDLKEQDVIFGGERKLARAIDELVEKYPSKVVFVYSTCIVGVIGDDLEAICKAAAQRNGIEVIPVQSSGFIGNKAAGYRAACDALLRLIQPALPLKRTERTLNYLGDFNLAGEVWIIRNYLKQMGVDMNVAFTGDSGFEKIKKATSASLNIIQCAGSMIYLAEQMRELYGLPYLNVSFLGLEDTGNSLRKIAAHFGDKTMMERAEKLIETEMARVKPGIQWYGEKLQAKKPPFMWAAALRPSL